MAAKAEEIAFSPQPSSDFSLSSDAEFLSSPEESPRRLWEAGDACSPGAPVCQDVHYDNKNTQRSMKTAVVAFRDFLIDNGLNPAFEEMPPEKLDAALTLFFSNARKRNRELYKWSTFSGIRYGIYRHLLCCVPSVDIMHSRDFASSQRAFNEKIKMIKEAGKGEVNHMPTMTMEDTERLYRSGVLSADNPQGLQRKVFFELLYFLLKQKRGHVLRDLMRDDVRFAVNQAGKWYAYILKNDCGQRIILEEYEKVYEIPGCPLCPIQSLLKYKSKLHPACAFFFQQPKKLPTPEDMSSSTPFADDPIWYTERPMGKNALSNVMAAISEDAGLSQIYSNSSIRSCAEVIDGQLTLHLPSLLIKLGDVGTESGNTQGLSSRSSPTRPPQMFASSVPTSSYTVTNPQMFSPLPHLQVSHPGALLPDSAVPNRFFPLQTTQPHRTDSMSPPLPRLSFREDTCAVKGSTLFSSASETLGEGNFTRRNQGFCTSVSASNPPMYSLDQSSMFSHHCSSGNVVQEQTAAGNRSTAAPLQQPVAQQRSRNPAEQETVGTCANSPARNRPSNYAEQLLNQLNQQRRDRKMCDVTIIAGRQRFAAHKGVLATESTYLKNLFYKEGKTSEVDLPSPLASGVHVLLDYMYSGTLELTQENVNEVFSAANFLQMDRAVSLCLEFLKRSCQR